MRPKVIKDPTGEWKFQFPEEMEAALDEYYSYVELIDYDEKGAQLGLGKLIEQFPDSHIDAYNHLSISKRNQNKIDEALRYAISAYIIGIGSFPPAFNHHEDKLSWFILENRAFLRSLQILGLELMKGAELNRAVQLFKQNLAYNPIDNQGIRYLLTEIYHYKNEEQLIKDLNEKYPEENLLEEVLSWDERIL